ncbi:hypothetical protein BV25DRAFT_1825997, partial [Artomyces pyxidatus]
RSLALVSREWYAKAAPMLYQCLLIEKDAYVERIRDTLEASIAATSASSSYPAGLPLRTLGSWTQHLVLSIEFWIVPLPSSDLETVVRCPTNLQILSISSLFGYRPGWHALHYGEPFSRALVETCSLSLRKLHFDCDMDFLLTPRQIASLVSSTPHLRTLTGRGALYTSPVVLPVLPELTYICTGPRTAPSGALPQPICPFAYLPLRNGGAAEVEMAGQEEAGWGGALVCGRRRLG